MASFTVYLESRRDKECERKDPLVTVHTSADVIIRDVQ